MVSSVLERRTAACLASVVVLMVGCTVQDTTTGLEARSDVRAAAYELLYSSGFYYDPSDGYYHWDGQPPPGDQTAPSIRVANAWAVAPQRGTGGWTEGSMLWVDGDLAQIELVPWAWKVFFPGGEQYAPVSSATSPWTGAECDRTISHTCVSVFSYRHPLGLTDTVWNCGSVVGVSGYARAKKKAPFGLVGAGVIKLINAFEPVEWGFTERALVGEVTTGPSCDTAPTPEEMQCDDPGTTDIEYCPVDGDPANPPSAGGAGYVYEGTYGELPRPSFGSDIGFGCLAEWHMQLYVGGVLVREWRECAIYGWYEQ